jgi:hypothetical protein
METKPVCATDMSSSSSTFGAACTQGHNQDTCPPEVVTRQVLSTQQCHPLGRRLQTQPDFVLRQLNAGCAWPDITQDGLHGLGGELLWVARMPTLPAGQSCAPAVPSESSQLHPQSRPQCPAHHTHVQHTIPHSSERLLLINLLRNRKRACTLGEF